MRGLPTLHRRGLVFVISFAQLFLESSVVMETKMTAQNLGKSADLSKLMRLTNSPHARAQRPAHIIDTFGDGFHEFKPRKQVHFTAATAHAP